MNASDLAILFHETYERLAPSFGYETRQETRRFDENSSNGRLMIAVCAEILTALKAGADDPFMPTPTEWATHPEMEWAATDGEGRLWLFADKPYYTPDTSTIWRCGGCELIPLRFAAPPQTSVLPCAIVPKVSNDTRYCRR